MCSCSTLQGEGRFLIQVNYAKITDANKKILPIAEQDLKNILWV